MIQSELYGNIKRNNGSDYSVTQLFDSVGELFAWLEKRGWKPNWHTEPQDSIDFTLQSMQNYLKRLVQGEAAIGDQVEDRRKQLELAERMEINEVPSDEEEILESIEYEDEDDSEAGDDYDNN